MSREGFKIYLQAESTSIGLNIGADKVYDPKKQKNWFFLDLETGRGNLHTWFPGCRLYGKLLAAVDLYADCDEHSTIIGTLTENTNLYLEELDSKKLLTQDFDWYKIKAITLPAKTGYVKINKYYIGNIEYRELPKEED